MDDTTIATIICFFLLIALPQSHCEEEENKYTVCSKPYNCGKISNISYPFWGDNRPYYCGGGDQFKLNCDAHQNTFMQIASENFTVLDIDMNAGTIRMVGSDLLSNDVCTAANSITPYTVDLCTAGSPADFADTILSTTLFQYTQNVHIIYIFNYCASGSISIGGNNFTCQFPYEVTLYCAYLIYGHASNQTTVFYVEEAEHFPELMHNCSMYMQVPLLQSLPVRRENGIDALKQALHGGFEVNYSIAVDDGQECIRCLDSRGACGKSVTLKHQFSCHCADGSDALQCYGHTAPTSNSLSWERKAIIGVATAATGGLLICVAICCFRSKPSIPEVKFWFTSKSGLDIEAFLKNHRALTLKRYSFSDVKKMTSSFKVKLGQGGFGTVYKGKLLTGDLVAVKMLNASKGNGEEFINEVASISRTSHVNVVTLLGFCLEGPKKVLIYEFVANGSLEKFIYKMGPETTPSLSWEILYQIAVGIAQGLEYLHRGCNTRILHFDIKPHNILLDENFCPKISDFGLAKLCTRKESTISMSDARGTMGYVAPEVWNRHFGGVSHKSDVYSYGMMLLEMVGGRKNIDVFASHTSEIYFPHWVYKRLEVGTHLELDGVISAEENEIAKRMTVIGLWCVQTIPNDRPTISKVIDMLKGNMNSLEIPPKPILSSPTTSIPESSSLVN